MYIKNVSIKNFKSIEQAEIKFTPLTIIVGPNASGKSNLISVFRFIEDIIRYGIDNAIMLQGGIQYISCANIAKGENVEIEFALDLSTEQWKRVLRDRKFALHIQEITYKFIIKPNQRGMGYKINYDYLKIKYGCCSLSDGNRGKRYKNLNILYITVFERDNYNTDIKPVSDIIPKDNEYVNDLNEQLINDIFTDYFVEMANEIKSELMLFRLPLLLSPAFSVNTFIRTFDFDPKELKKASQIASTNILNENGSNIAFILKKILKNKEQEKKFRVLVNRFLPFVNSISIENNPDKSMSYKIEEKYNNKEFYSNFLSDGTVSIFALIIALYFEDQSNIIILEEPERNIHPKLLLSLLSAVNDVSKEKQVVITTHNPELLRHAQINDILFTKRDEKGRTIVNKPANNKNVIRFIEQDLGLDDLFLQNLLGE